MKIDWHPLLLDNDFLEEYIAQAPSQFLDEMSHVDNFPRQPLLSQLLAMWQRIPEYSENRSAVREWKYKLMKILGVRGGYLPLISDRGLGDADEVGHFKVVKFIDRMNQFIEEYNIDTLEEHSQWKEKTLGEWIDYWMKQKVVTSNPPPYKDGLRKFVFERLEIIPREFLVYRGYSRWPLINWDVNPLEVKS